MTDQVSIRHIHRVRSRTADPVRGRMVRRTARASLAVLTAAALTLTAAPAQAAPALDAPADSTPAHSTAGPQRAALDYTLAGLFDHACMTVPGTAAYCDDQGRSLDRTALRHKGFVPGRTIALGSTGLSADIPLTSAGRPDALTARGQLVGVNLGKGATRLSLIGFATGGTQGGQATITYTDGTTQTFALTFGDWVAAARAPIDGNRVLLRTTGRLLAGGGSDAVTTGIFYLRPITLARGKTVRTVTVPNLDQALNEGQVHILAVASNGVRTPFSDVRVAPVRVREQRVDTPFTAALATVTGGRRTGGYLATVLWGDDTPVSRITTGRNGRVTGHHTYDFPGTYSVRVIATDGLTVNATDTVITVTGTARTPHVTLSAGTRAPGQQLIVTGTGFGTKEQVYVHLYTDPSLISTLTTRADGSVSTTLTVPQNTRPGVYRVGVEGLRSRRYVEADLTITAS